MIWSLFCARCGAVSVGSAVILICRVRKVGAPVGQNWASEGVYAQLQVPMGRMKFSGVDVG